MEVFLGNYTNKVRAHIAILREVNNSKTQIG